MAITHDGSSGKLVRWRLCLSKLDFDAVHRAGIKNQAADTLPRLAINGKDGGRLDEDFPVVTCGGKCGEETSVSKN